MIKKSPWNLQLEQSKHPENCNNDFLSPTSENWCTVMKLSRGKECFFPIECIKKQKGFLVKNDEAEVKGKRTSRLQSGGGVVIGTIVRTLLRSSYPL